VKVNPSSVVARVAKSSHNTVACSPACAAAGYTQCPSFNTLMDNATSVGSLAMINAIWWNVCNGNSVGYTYSNGYVPSDVWCDNRGGSTTDCSGSNVYYAEGGGALYPAGTSPMFTISRSNTMRFTTIQKFSIVQSNDNFLETPSTQWSQIGSPPHPIWDVSPRDGVSDVSYALQIPNPPLVRNGSVIAGGDFVYDKYGNYDYAFARTSIGVGPGGMMYLVVADGEGVMGGNGATANQLAHFFRDVLQATTAMGLDSGLSTQMILRGSAGPRRVNTLTGEDATIQIDPYSQVLDENPGAFGAVAYYLMFERQAWVNLPRRYKREVWK